MSLDISVFGNGKFTNVMTKLDLQEVQGDSKLLSVFPYSVILKPETTK